MHMQRLRESGAIVQVKQEGEQEEKESAAECDDEKPSEEEECAAVLEYVAGLLEEHVDGEEVWWVETATPKV
jgi:hypothetical protein